MQALLLLLCCCHLLLLQLLPGKLVVGLTVSV
jgi:hypothetical protein